MELGQEYCDTEGKFLGFFFKEPLLDGTTGSKENLEVYSTPNREGSGWVWRMQSKIQSAYARENLTEEGFSELDSEGWIGICEKETMEDWGKAKQ